MQEAVVALLRTAKGRRPAKAYFASVCANDSCAGVAGGDVGRENFEAVIAFLFALGVFALLFVSDSDADGCWRLGVQDGRRLGALRWDSRSGHVSLVPCAAGVCKVSVVEPSPSLCSVVGAPKSGEAKAKPAPQPRGRGGVFASAGSCAGLASASALARRIFRPRMCCASAPRVPAQSCLATG